MLLRNCNEQGGLHLTRYSKPLAHRHTRLTEIVKAIWYAVQLIKSRASESTYVRRVAPGVRVMLPRYFQSARCQVRL